MTRMMVLDTWRIVKQKKALGMDSLNNALLGESNSYYDLQAALEEMAQ